MRLLHVFVVIGATFLASCGVYSTTTDANQFEVFKVTSPIGSNQRLLRAHQTTVDSEERSLLKPKHEAILAKLAEKLQIDLTSIRAQYHPKYPEYQAKLHELIDMRKAKASRKKFLGIF
ncbi:Avirulence protein (Avh) [Phytophthora palmivora]|uniref:RxLR effector protein n=1 Tax=Phytophthora palmivora TaxID=4796 RepID=A0A2P4YIG3_9STRA|nr:Avirulence protein (Avh) [Phytophthora palmivora]